MRDLLNRTLSAILSNFNLTLLKTKAGEHCVIMDANSHIVPSFIGRSAKKMTDIRNTAVFGDVAAKVIASKRTYLHYDRLYTIFGALQNVARLCGNSTSLNIAEVGVFRGGGTYFLAESCARLKLNASINSFDTFEGHSQEDLSSPKDDTKTHTAGHFSGVSFEDVEEYLKEFQNVKLHKGRFQDQSHRIEKLEFSFVHLDVDIYEPTVYALNFFAKRMRPGGIIVVDDYGFATCPGIPVAIEEFTAAHKEFVSLVQLTGQCVLVKVAGKGC